MSDSPDVPAVPPSLRRCQPVTVSPALRDEYETRGFWTDDTLPVRLADAARRTPDRLAVVDQGGQRTVTYAVLLADVRRAARLLTAHGVLPGEVVAIQLPNWYETVVLDLAVLSLGCTLNPMLPIYRSREIAHMTRVAGTRLIVTPEQYRKHGYRPMIDEVIAGSPGLETHLVIADPATEPGAFAALLQPFDDGPLHTELDAQHVSELMFTSGTEAQPKAIMHTECTTNFSVRACGRMLRLGDDDVIWMPSPIGHSTGLNYGVRMALYHGLTLVLQDHWNAAEAVDLVSRFRCTYTVAATTFLADLLVAARASRADVSSMRLFCSGGAAVPAALVESASEVGITVLRLYGSTEILIGTWNRPESPLTKRIETDGIPLDGVAMEIRDDEGQQIEGAGEIFVRSPSVCVGYFDDAERTADTFAADGWSRTGDLGIIDADRYLTIVGRKKEIIIRGGLNVAPREVEEVIQTLPGVADVAVVGIPDERLGEIGCACIVLEPGHTLTLPELTGALRSRGLAAYKLPERLEIVTTLPTTSTGKVQKNLLRDHLVHAVGTVAPLSG